MTRSFFSVIAVGIVGLALSPALLGGCQQTGVGDPCTPEQEYDPTFNNFAVSEVNVESKSFQCQTRLCLVNHFQGRVSCPYGQTTANQALVNGLPGCGVPGSKADTSGKYPSGQAIGDQQPVQSVKAQCTDRRADKAVYCSCRCANVDGRTDDGANYCKCPDGYACQQLVTPIGPTDTGLTGAYCVKSGTVYDSTKACAAVCDPAVKNCGSNNSGT
jgi:hypothetical protein